MVIAVSLQVTLLGIKTPFGACVDRRILTSSLACPIAPLCHKTVETMEGAVMPKLSGKVAIVTGASRGIGAAVARALADAGASVMLAARTVAQAEANAREIRAAGGKATTFACDVADYAACQRLVHETAERFGLPDLLVNNAGVIEPISTVGVGDPSEWARSIGINLIGAYYAIRAVLPGMIERGHGSIINVSSGAAHRPQEGWSAYCAGKAGLAMLTRSIDLEHRAAGIRVFGFQPGTTDTDMQVIIRASGVNPISRIPREQLTPVAHPARGIVYLCTNDADDLAGKEINLGDAAFRKRIGL
jgi:NAD(P)-dependent dehydrogenase (short-subunit alcohol dehydrogenase family)